MKHTEGPWRIAKRDKQNRRIYGPKHEGIADMIRIEANAQLIAAAPELLEACKYVVQHHREKDSGEGELFGLDFVTTCIAVINKAEGR